MHVIEKITKESPLNSITLKGAYHTFLKKLKKIKMEKTFIPQYFMPMSSH